MTSNPAPRTPDEDVVVYEAKLRGYFQVAAGFVIAFVVVPAIVLVALGRLNSGQLLEIAVLFAIPCVLVWLAGLMIIRGGMVANPSRDGLPAEDRRPPVVFLRSFRKDGTEARLFKLIGPVVCIEDPRSELQTPGAIPLRTEDWRQSVRELIARAQLVVLRPDDTPGVTWETNLVASQVDPRRIILDHAHQDWTSIRAAVASALPCELPRRAGRCHYFAFTRTWKPFRIRKRPTRMWTLRPIIRNLGLETVLRQPSFLVVPALTILITIFAFGFGLTGDRNQFLKLCVATGLGVALAAQALRRKVTSAVAFALAVPGLMWASHVTGVSALFLPLVVLFMAAIVFYRTERAHEAHMRTVPLQGPGDTETEIP